MKNKKIFYLVGGFIFIVIIGIFVSLSYSSKVTREGMYDFFKCHQWDNNKSECNKYKVDNANVCKYDNNECNFKCNLLNGNESDCNKHLACSWDAKKKKCN
jgi:hypothetical protein